MPGVPVWMNKKILDKLKHKARRGMWGEYRKVVQIAKHQVRKAKALTELNLDRDIKGNKENFYRYISNKSKSNANVGPFQKEMRDLVI